MAYKDQYNKNDNNIKIYNKDGTTLFKKMQLW